MLKKLNITKEKLVIVAVSGVIFGLIGFYIGKYSLRKEMQNNFQQRRMQNSQNETTIQNGQQRPNWQNR